MEYVPFCDVSQDDIGECIGYCDVPVKDAEPVRHFIYTLRDYSSEELIVEADSENADSGLVYREKSVEYAPEGLMLEYNMEDEGIDDIAGEEEKPGVTYVHETGVYVVDGDMVFEYKLELTGRSPNAAYNDDIIKYRNALAHVKNTPSIDSKVIIGEVDGQPIQFDQELCDQLRKKLINYESVLNDMYEYIESNY